MSITRRDEYIDLLQQGELLDEEQLATARRITQSLTDIAAVAKRLVEKNLLTRWQANELLRGRQPRKVDCYQLLDLLETQAAGPVFLAKHVSQDYQVVLKALARLSHSDVPTETLLTEARKLATLDHPNLCQVHDVVSDDEFHYLVIEHVTGRNLRQIVDAEGPFPPITAAGLAAMAAGALAHAHRQGIRHLGIRPERLIIDSISTLKIVDVGMERLKSLRGPAETAETSDDHAFLAPEQKIAEYPVDERADIYSLGCVLSYSIVGTPPRPVSIAPVPPETPLPSPQQDNAVQPELPAELAEICSRLMAPLPEDRFESADEAAQALESWIRSVAPAPPSTAADDVETPLAVALGLKRKRRVGAARRSTESQQRQIILGVVIGAVLLAILMAAVFWPEESPRSSSDTRRAKTSRIGPRANDKPDAKMISKRPQVKPEFAAPTSPPPLTQPSRDLSRPIVLAEPPDPEPPHVPPVASEPAKVDRTFELGAAVELPDIAQTTAAAAQTELTVLGKVHCDPAQVTLSLLGGDVASHELGTFRLQPGPTTQPFRWVAKFRSAESASSLEIVIAEIVLADQQLGFRWREESRTVEEADCLRNCLLQIAAGKTTQRIALRTPLGARHLRLGVSSNRPEVESYKIPGLPKGGRLKCELLSDNINLPTHEISKKVLNIESDLAELTFAVPDAVPLVVGIRTYTEDTLLIGTRAHWTAPGGQQRFLDRAALARQRDDLQRRQTVAAAAKRHDKYRSSEEQISSVLSLADEIEAAGPVPFRVVMDVDGHEVVVLQSDRQASDESPQLTAFEGDVPAAAPASPKGGQIPGWRK